METKTRLALRHIDSGLFLSWSPDSMPHAKRLSQARRFSSMDELSLFLTASPYAPDDPGEYDIVEIEIQYTLKEAKEDVQEKRIDRHVG